MNLVIDIGNTSAKLAIFDGAALLEVVYDSNQTLERLPGLCSRYDIEQAIVATVIDLSESASAQLSALRIPLFRLGADTPLPVETSTRHPKPWVTTAWLPWWEPANSFRVETFW